MSNSDNFEILHETVDKPTVDKPTVPISRIDPIRFRAFKDVSDTDTPPAPMISAFAATVLLAVGTVLSAAAISCFLWVLVELIYIIGYKAF